MVVPLREAGHGDGAQEASVFDADGEAAAVAGVVGEGQAAGFQRGLLLLHFEADGVGAAMKPEDNVALAAHPFRIVGRSAREGRVEERLGAAADIDDEGESAFDRERAKARAETPGGFFVESGEDQLTFLEGNASEIFGDGHGQAETETIQYKAGFGNRARGINRRIRWVVGYARQ